MPYPIDVELRLVDRQEHLRRHHGYVVRSALSTIDTSALATPARAIEREIVEAHALPLESPIVRSLVTRWLTAVGDLARYVGSKHQDSLDLVDVSTLAAMYANAAGFA